MSFDDIFAQLLIPRPNGSEGLEQAAAFIRSALEAQGGNVVLESFSGTPHGFQIVWSSACALMAAYVLALGLQRYALALVLSLLPPVLLLLEFELLWSPVSGLLAETQHNVVGTFPGRSGGPTLILGAHYDTTTHIGDHFTWHRWVIPLSLASAVAPLLAIVGLVRARSGRRVPAALRLGVGAAAVVPYAAMALFFAVGPVVRTPSVGAIDNGGSVAVLLRLAERLSSRAADSPTTVRLVFFAAEEERALGSWHHAQGIAREGGLSTVINLESLGAGEQIAYVPEDGFEFARYRSPRRLIEFVNETARELWGAPLEEQRMPPGTLTDGRSFLANGIPAVTLRGRTAEGFPRRLHSMHDAYDRLSMRGLERGVDLLEALIRRMDASATVMPRAGNGP